MPSDDPASANQVPAPSGRPPTVRLVVGFCIGAIYLALVAAVVDAATQYSFWYALVMIASAACLLFFIFLAIAVRAATGRQGWWQVHLSTLLLLTAAVAIYLGLMQWLVRGAGVAPANLPWGEWIAVFALSGLALVLSVPYILFLGESLMWLAVWLVRRRITQRLLRLALRRPARSK